MKVHGPLLQRHSGEREGRTHEGRVAVDQRNTRWCSDALEIACGNGEKVSVALALSTSVIFTHSCRVCGMQPNSLRSTPLQSIAMNDPAHDRTIHTVRSRTSGANLFVALLI